MSERQQLVLQFVASQLIQGYSSRCRESNGGGCGIPFVSSGQASHPYIHIIHQITSLHFYHWRSIQVSYPLGYVKWTVLDSTKERNQPTKEYQVPRSCPERQRGNKPRECRMSAKSTFDRVLRMHTREKLPKEIEQRSTQFE